MNHLIRKTSSLIRYKHTTIMGAISDNIGPLCVGGIVGHIITSNTRLIGFYKILVEQNNKLTNALLKKNNELEEFKTDNLKKDSEIK